MSEEQNQIKKGQRGQQLADEGLSSKAAREQALHPYTSYWPFVLAVALCILLLGVITNLVVLAVGAVLTAAAIIGWGLEHR